MNGTTKGPKTSGNDSVEESNVLGFFSSFFLNANNFL